MARSAVAPNQSSNRFAKFGAGAATSAVAMSLLALKPAVFVS